MATVVDALVVELGLDPTKFTQSQKDAIAAFKKTQEAAHKTAVDIESQFQRASQVFSELRNQVIGLYALFTAGRGIRDFAEDLTHTDADVGRLARTMDIATGALAAWRGAAVLVGGTASGITQSMQGLVQQFQQFSLTGESSVIPYFRALGVNIADANGKMRPMGDILLDLSDKFSKLDPARALAIGQALGLDQGTINLLIQGRGAVSALLAEQERLGHVSEEDAKAAQARQKAWEEFTLTATQLGRQILTVITPALVIMAKGLTSITVWANEHPKALQAIFYGITAAVIALTTALTVLGVVFLATPFGLVIAGIAAVTAGWTYLITTVHSFQDVWDLLVDAFQHSPFQLLIDGFGLILRAGEALVGVFHSLLDAWHALWGGVKGNTGGTAASGFDKNTTNTLTRGRGAVSAEADIQRLMAMGWTRAQATGIAANIQRESGGVAGAVGDNGSAYGLAQWHPDRQAAFAKWAGHDIRNSTREEQLGFINYELRSGSDVGARRAGRALAGATNAGSAAAIVSRLYERPGAANAEASTRSALALALLQAPAGVASLGPQASAASLFSTTNNRTSSSNAMTDIKIGEITIETKATDATGIAKEIGPAVQRNAFTQQVNYGAN